MDEVRHTEQFQYIDLVIEIVQFVCAPVYGPESGLRSGPMGPDWVQWVN